VPGTAVRCDARIVDDVLYLIDRFGLVVTACFAATGHAAGGEHPLGLAIDAVPKDGDWARTAAAARFFGWRPDCAPAGCAGTVRAPMRVVLYNGYPGHGDPAHCAPAACAAHLHLSWAHAPAQPLTPAPWVETLTSAGPRSRASPLRAQGPAAPPAQAVRVARSALADIAQQMRCAQHMRWVSLVV
jgi:hypothetical protein